MNAADAYLTAMIDATADVWAALTDSHSSAGARVNAAMAFFADAAVARNEIDRIGYRSNYAINPSNPDAYAAARANMNLADKAITEALEAIGR